MTRRMHPEDRAFLPAALAVQQTPPSPLGRTLLWSIVACLGTALAWACWGQLDIVTVAPGRLISSDRIQVVQSFGHGVIDTIHVQDGELVEAGQLLVSLDPTAAMAERDRLAVSFEAADAERRRLIAELAALALLAAPERAGSRAESLPEMPRAQHRAFAARLAEWFATRAVTTRDLAAQRAELRVAEARVARHAATLPIVSQRAHTLEALAAKGHVATDRWLELEQQRLALQHDLATERLRAQQLETAIDALVARSHAQTAERRRSLETELAGRVQRTEELRDEQDKAEHRLLQMQIHAPSAGHVQQLAVHTPGGVVTPAQELLRIVPRGQRLEVEARLANRDIGHVLVGHPATVKVDSYPYTRHGTLSGTVRLLSADAVEDERGGLAYGLRIALQSTTLRGGSDVVSLRPGMAVSVEIATGKRRIIDYLLTPLVRAARESMRER